MEGFYGSNSSKVPKIKPLKENVSPLNPQNFIGRSRYHHHPPKSPVFDSYASSDSTNSPNSGSPLIKYLRSASLSIAAGDDSYKSLAVDSPECHFNSSKSNSNGGFGSRGLTPVSVLSAVENLETRPARSAALFKTPMKIEEDVLVMDGILVSSVPCAKTRTSSSLSDSNSRRRSSLSSLDSGGTSSSRNNSSYYKTETCWFWEDSGCCGLGSKCQFAHGKEDLRPTRLPNNNKSEAQICKSYSSGLCNYGAKCRFVHHQVTNAASPTIPTAATMDLAPNQTVSPIKLEDTTGSGSSGNIVSKSTDWSPQDDGIKVALPSCASPGKTPSKEDVDAHIQSVLYGPSNKKRLPVFAEICPE
ncbi:unnamed protein product [Ilex paraguariensis]|uniref:C3H1-type domain-containing protein n=1 Tax=Ilex paraguariensis TaxID=185542 RepID=A0ABC8STD8_9AQUA